MKDLLLQDVLSYCEHQLAPVDPVLQALDRETHLTTIAPQMSAGHYQGVLLRILSQSINPQRILEIGTFNGYAAICLARGLAEGGSMDTIEVDPERESTIRKYLEGAHLAARVRLHIGDAHQIMQTLNGPFQLIYVDAGKQDYPAYYDSAIALLDTRGLLIFDNVLWSGKVVHNASDTATQQMLAFNSMVREDPRVASIILPVRDGMTLVSKL